eukprot:TRINITY_DN27643_c0_g1_i1.p1 TRINITY_DN27643_c0_g1~~TRINITY_DN27643_c0_g1_i1.p1  ORF type:complete len:1624 (+),score=440.38 TRINITY_DN27643_c0_g1_i1:120-4991(+)
MAARPGRQMSVRHGSCSSMVENAEVRMEPLMDPNRPSLAALSSEAAQASQRKLDNVSLESLRAAFGRAAGVADDILGEAALDQGEFVEAFLPVFHASREEMVALFRRVDVNDNGLLGWDEFASFLLLNSSVATEETRLDEDRSFARGYESLPHGADCTRWVEHHDTISKILVHPRQPTFISASQDGTVKMWNSHTLRHQRTILNGSAWITDVIHTPPHLPLYPNGSIIAASIDRVVSLFDASTGDLLRTYRGKKKWMHDNRMEVQFRHPFGLPSHCAPWAAGGAHTLSGEAEVDNIGQTELYSNTLRHFRRRQKIDMVHMEHLETVPWSLGHLRTHRKDLLLIGSDTGIIKIYDISRDVPAHEVSIPCENYDKATGQEGWDTGHVSTITKILPVPSMESIITSSKDTTLRLLDIETGVMLRVLGVEPTIPKEERTPGMEVVHTNVDERLGHMKPVTTFSWCDDRRLIASCGRERHAVVWNPFISKPIVKLRGHRTPLIDVVFNSGDNQLVTLSTDKVVKVWDLRTFQCLQTLPDEAKYPGEDRLGALAYDARTHRIVTGSKRLHLRSMLRGEECGANHHGREQLIGAAYSAEAKQVISVDVHRVITWDVRTQTSLVNWRVPVGVTTCCLDQNQRRLLVGTRDGKVHLYNYLNASFLKACTTHPQKMEHPWDPTAGVGGHVETIEPPVSSDISTVGFYIINTPSGAVLKIIASTKGNWLYVHEDTDTDDEVHPLMRLYLGDVKGVYSVAFLPPAMLVFGTGTGEVVIASLVDRTRPVVIPRSTRPHYIGNAPGPLYTPALRLSDARPGFVDTSPVETITEAVLLLERTARAVLTAHGDGTISVWDIPSARPGACKASSFTFRAGFEGTDAVLALATNTDETSLFACTAGGYYLHYDVSAFTADAASVKPGSVKRVGCVRVSDHGVKHLSYIAKLGILLAVTVGSGLMLITLEGYLLSSFRAPVQDLTHPLTAYRPLFSDTAAHAAAQRHHRAEWLRQRLAERPPAERFTAAEAGGVVAEEFGVSQREARETFAYLEGRWADMISIKPPCTSPCASVTTPRAPPPTLYCVRSHKRVSVATACPSPAPPDSLVSVSMTPASHPHPHLIIPGSAAASAVEPPSITVTLPLDRSPAAPTPAPLSDVLWGDGHGHAPTLSPHPPSDDPDAPARKKPTTQLVGSPGCFADGTQPLPEAYTPGSLPRRRHHRQPKNPLVVPESEDLAAPAGPADAAPCPQRPTGQYRYPKTLRPSRGDGRFTLYTASGGRWKVGKQRPAGADEGSSDGNDADDEEASLPVPRRPSPPDTTLLVENAPQSPMWLAEEAERPAQDRPSRRSIGRRPSDRRGLLWLPEGSADSEASDDDDAPAPRHGRRGSGTRLLTESLPGHLGRFGDVEESPSTTLNTTPSPRAHDVWRAGARPLDEIFSPAPQQRDTGGWGAAVKREVLATMTKDARKAKAVMCYGDELRRGEGRASPHAEKVYPGRRRSVTDGRVSIGPTPADMGLGTALGTALSPMDQPVVRKTPRMWRGRPLCSDVTSVLSGGAEEQAGDDASPRTSDEELHEKIAQVKFQILADQPVRLRTQPLPPNKAPKPMACVEMAEVRNPGRGHRKIVLERIVGAFSERTEKA